MPNRAAEASARGTPGQRWEWSVRDMGQVWHIRSRRPIPHPGGPALFGRLAGWKRHTLSRDLSGSGRARYQALPDGLFLRVSNPPVRVLQPCLMGFSFPAAGRRSISARENPAMRAVTSIVAVNRSGLGIGDLGLRSCGEAGGPRQSAPTIAIVGASAREPCHHRMEIERQ